MLGGGHAERLGGGIDIEPGFPLIDARRDHRQADAIAGDRGAVSDGGPLVTACDTQAMQLPSRRWRQANALADVGDIAGKLQAPPWMVSCPFCTFPLARCWKAPEPPR